MNLVNKLIRMLGGSDSNESDKYVENERAGGVIAEDVDTDTDVDVEYQYEETDTDVMHGVELYSHGHRNGVDRENRDPEVFMGDFFRQVIEASNETPKTFLGYTTENGAVESLGVNKEQMLRNMALFGQTGQGKSTLVNSMLLQFAYSGHGFCLSTERSHDIDTLIETLPESRIDDLVIVQPENGVNVFDVSFDEETNLFDEYADGLTSRLLGRNTSVGPKNQSIIHSLIKEFVRADETFTLEDLVAVLSDSEDARDRVQEAFEDETVMQEVSDLDDDDLAPITRRVRTLIESEEVRSLVADEESQGTIQNAVEEDKIIVLDYSSMSLDADAAERANNLIGEQVWGVLQQRTYIPKAERTPFFVVFDGMHTDYSNTGIEEKLAMSRQLKVGYILSQQQMGQIADSPRQEIKNNCANVLSGRMGATSIESIEEVLEIFGDDISEKYLMELPRFHFHTKISTDDGPKSNRIEIFPQYPPVRSEEKVKNIKESATEG